MKKFWQKKISLASRGDAKNRGIFNSIDLKNPIKSILYYAEASYLINYYDQICEI